MKKMSPQTIGIFFVLALALQTSMSTSAWAFGPARPSENSTSTSGDDLLRKVQDQSYPAYGVIHYLFQRATPVVDLKQVKLNQNLVCKVDARHGFYAGKEEVNSRPEVAIVRLKGSDGLYAFEKSSEYFVSFDSQAGPSNAAVFGVTGVRKSEPIVVGMQEFDGVNRLAAFKLDLSGPMVTPEFRLSQSGDLMIRIGEVWDQVFYEDSITELGYSYMFCR